MNYGYARVSDPAQDPARQVAELQVAGCERIFVEKASAAGGRKRPQAQKALAALQPGDVLTVVSLDRLARSSRDALNLLETVRQRGALFRSLAEAWADMTTPAGRFMLAVLAGFAEFDRERILERTSEGRAWAKARGVKMGRPSTLNARQRRYVIRALASRPKPSLNELATALGVSRSTISRVARAKVDGHAPNCLALRFDGNAVCNCGAEPPAAGDQLDLEQLAR